MAINVKDKLVTVESLGIAYSTEQGARQEADQALSTRIDNIVAPDGDPSLTEVSDARVSGSTTHNTLKARLDADQAAVGTEIAELKADLGAEVYANTLSQLDTVSNFRNVLLGKDSTQKLYAPATRGSMTTAGEIQAHTKRCIIKYSGVSVGNKLYFDASVYKIYVVYFYQGERVGSTGWQTTSPFVHAVTNSDCVYVVVERLDNAVVNIEDAIKNIYFEYTASSDLATRKVKYVSLSGNDSASGDATHPLLTVNKALEMGAEIVNISEGTYEQQIDLSKYKNGIVQLNNYSATGNVIFTPANRTVATSETLVDGYTKVYSAPCSIEFASSNVWLFQENASDARTVISNTERLPQQRGLYYRCYDTKIEKCTSASLSDALAEIESSDDYKWFVDDGTIYFSRPNTVSSSAPIRYSDGSLLFLNANRSHTIIANGIATRYMSFNIDETTNSELVDCKSTNVYGDGAFTYDNAIGAKLIRCEASRCFNGNVGDGINAHGQTGGTTSSKKTTAMIIDCWSHDNKDDGFSDHECCESVIDGGLFEYNGKAGITPSYGAHCVCKNVVSRQNYNGFYVTGKATQNEGGAYTQLLCFNCVSENNQRGSSNKAGYLTESNNNRMILVNCKSIGNHIGYYCTGGTLMAAIDCTSLSDDIVKTGGGTLTVQTGTVLSS